MGADIPQVCPLRSPAREIIHGRGGTRSLPRPDQRTEKDQRRQEKNAGNQLPKEDWILSQQRRVRGQHELWIRMLQI